MNNLP